VILTSAARSGGEVRITETERSKRVSAGRRGDWAGIAARSARPCGLGAERRVRGRCAGVTRFPGVSSGTHALIPDARRRALQHTPMSVARVVAADQRLGPRGRATCAIPQLPAGAC
jgi:hypothetical protein